MKTSAKCGIYTNLTSLSPISILDDFFLLEDNYFTVLCRFLPYISMNRPQVHPRPLPLEPPSCLPPHPTALGCHRALVSSLGYIAYSRWLSVLPMVAYMFPCHSVNSSHPPLPIPCPQVCSLSLCRDDV